MKKPDAIYIWKSVLVLLQFIYWTGGLFLFCISVWSYLNPIRGAFLTIIHTAGEDLLQLLCFVTGILGCWIFLVGFTGTIGTVQDRKKFLVISLVINVCLILVELLGVCLILGNYSTIKLSFRDVLKLRIVEEYGKPEYKPFIKAVDITQFQYSCCGVDGWSDYTKNTEMSWRKLDISHKSKFALTVPRTCCKLLNHKSHVAWERPQAENLAGCQSIQEQTFPVFRYTQGCFEKIDTLMKSNNIAIILAVIIFNFIQIMTVWGTITILRNLIKANKNLVYL